MLPGDGVEQTVLERRPGVDEQPDDTGADERDRPGDEDRGLETFSPFMLSAKRATASPMTTVKIVPAITQVMLLNTVRRVPVFSKIVW